MSLLGSFFVEFSTKGVEAVVGALGSVKKSLEATTAVASGATAVMLGFASAGIRASAEGQYLQNVMGRLSNEVGSLFIPVMELATKALEGALEWFRGLSQEQMNSLGAWASAAAAAVVFGKALSAIGVSGPIGVILSVVAAVVTLVASTEAGRSAFGKLWASAKRIFDILGPPMLKIFESLASIITTVVIPPLKLVAWAFEKIADGLEAIGLKAEKAKGGGHRTLTPGTPTITNDLTQAHRRIQEQASKLGQPQEKTDLQKIAENTHKTVEAVDATTRSIKEIKIGLPR